jgi:hypothetical protein
MICSVLFAPLVSSNFFGEDGDSALSLLQLHQKGTVPPESDETPDWCPGHRPACQTLERKNPHASANWWKMIGPRDEKPGWYEAAQGLAVGDNTAQNDAMKMHGTCNPDIMPLKNSEYGKHQTEWPPLTCANTVDNMVKNYPHLFGHPKTYPESVCGKGQARSRDPAIASLGVCQNVDEGPIYSFCHHDKDTDWGPNGRVIREGEDFARPWTEHLGDAIQMCQANFPLVQGVTCPRMDIKGRLVPKDSDIAPAGATYMCFCHRKSDVVRVPEGSKCDFKTALVAPAGNSKCPCSNGLSLTLNTPLHSNLGGAGPDLDSPEEIIFPSAGLVDGHEVNVRVWTYDTYAGNTMKNGVKGSLGRLNMKTNQEVTLQIAVVDAATNEPVMLSKSLPITFLDLDEGKKGKGRVTVTACGAQQFVTQSSELSSSTADGCSSVASTTRGTAKDNPSSVEGALTDDVASKRVVSYVMDATDTGIYSIKLNVAKGYGYRNFLFTLTPGAACSNEANLPKGCADALAVQGL